MKFWTWRSLNIGLISETLLARGFERDGWQARLDAAKIFEQRMPSKPGCSDACAPPAYHTNHSQFERQTLPEVPHVSRR